MNKKASPLNQEETYSCLVLARWSLISVKYVCGFEGTSHVIVTKYLAYSLGSLHFGGSSSLAQEPGALSQCRVRDLTGLGLSRSDSPSGGVVTSNNCRCFSELRSFSRQYRKLMVCQAVGNAVVLLSNAPLLSMTELVIPIREEFE